MRARWQLVGVGAAVVMTSALLLAGSALAVTITSFTPKAGLAEDQPYCPGGHVTITGTGFVSDGGVTAVAFGGVPAVDVQVGSDNTINVMVPKGAKTGPITVTTRAGTASTQTLNAASNVTPIGEISLPNNLFTVNDCWGRVAYDAAYGAGATTASSTAAAKASVSSFSPTRGKAGAKVTITGSNFTGATAVTFAGVKATFKVASATKITANVPSGAKTGKINVTTPAGTATSKGTFTKL
jgi:uncharacterized protein (TIGR03437 family)